HCQQAPRRRIGQSIAGGRVSWKTADRFGRSPGPAIQTTISGPRANRQGTLSGLESQTADVAQKRTPPVPTINRASRVEVPDTQRGIDRTGGQEVAILGEGEGGGVGCVTLEHCHGAGLGSALP